MEDWVLRFLELLADFFTFASNTLERRPSHHAPEDSGAKAPADEIDTITKGAISIADCSGILSALWALMFESSTAQQHHISVKTPNGWYELNLLCSVLVLQYAALLERFDSIRVFGKRVLVDGRLDVSRTYRSTVGLGTW